MVGPAAVLEKKSGGCWKKYLKAGGGGFWFVPLAEKAGLEKSKPKVGRLCLQRRWETAESKMHGVGAAALGKLFGENPKDRFRVFSFISLLKFQN